MHFGRFGAALFRVFILVCVTFSIGEGVLSCTLVFIRTGGGRQGHSIPDEVPMCIPFIQIFSLSSF